MLFLQNGLSVTLIITTSLLACASVVAKPFLSKDGCSPVSKIEYNAAKREYLLNSRARVYIEQDYSGDGIIGTVQCSPERAT